MLISRHRSMNNALERSKAAHFKRIYGMDYGEAAKRRLAVFTPSSTMFDKCVGLFSMRKNEGWYATALGDSLLAVRILQGASSSLFFSHFSRAPAALFLGYAYSSLLECGGIFTTNSASYFNGRLFKRSKELKPFPGIDKSSPC